MTGSLVISQTEKVTPLADRPRNTNVITQEVIDEHRQQIEAHKAAISMLDQEKVRSINDCDHHVQFARPSLAQMTAIAGVYDYFSIDCQAVCLLCGVYVEVCPRCASQRYAAQVLTRSQLQSYLSQIGYVRPEDTARTHYEFSYHSWRCADCGFETFSCIDYAMGIL